MIGKKRIPIREKLYDAYDSTALLETLKSRRLKFFNTEERIETSKGKKIVGS